MSDQRKGGITWTDETWNPIRGCSRVSEGCRNCYAERMAYRYSGPGLPYEGLARIVNGHPQWTGEVRVVAERTLDPLHWRQPRRIFVNSMSDLFHEQVADATIDRIFAVMALCPQHTFQILTKRPARMLAYLSAAFIGDRWAASAEGLLKEGKLAGQQFADRSHRRDGAHEWVSAFARGMLPNVWLGVSVEHQAAADERIPLLLKTPAAVRWISAEPLLGAIKLMRRHAYCPTHDFMGGFCMGACPDLLMLDWVVVGGESGPAARPMEEAWALSLRDQCVAAGVAFHFKQWGEWLPAWCHGAPGGFQHIVNASDQPVRVGKRAAGRLLDGREWDEYPQLERKS